MAASTSARGGLFARMYRGESNLDFIGTRKRWYIASAIIILVCVLSIVLRGFNYGIDFKGGDQFTLPIKPGTTLSQIEDAVSATGVDVAQGQTAGSSGSSQYRIETKALDQDQQNAVTAALAKAGNVSASDVSFTSVSDSWGGEVSRQAIEALIVFLIVVSAFISIRFRDWRMAVAAFGALIHDLVLTAGVYSIIGFSVTPSTIVGLLTILGFSLYDTVVVFDKVDENSRGILAASRYTYAEAANNAVNQTIMRSINTSLIGLLPVAGLLFVGAGILGVGTLEDLALVLFVGMLTGAYSSLFLATPWLVDLKMLDPRYKNHAARIMARRANARAKEEGKAATRPAPRGAQPADEVVAEDGEPANPEDVFAGSAAPRVGTKPPARAGSGAKGAAAKRSGHRPSNRPGGAKRR